MCASAVMTLLVETISWDDWEDTFSASVKTEAGDMFGIVSFNETWGFAADEHAKRMFSNHTDFLCDIGNFAVKHMTELCAATEDCCPSALAQLCNHSSFNVEFYLPH